MLFRSSHYMRESQSVMQLSDVYSRYSCWWLLWFNIAKYFL